MIFEIFPLQPACEHIPANRVRPFDILISFPFLIGPYVLHFRQKPSIDVMIYFTHRNRMNSLANKMQISTFQPPTRGSKSSFFDY